MTASPLADLVIQDINMSVPFTRPTPTPTIVEVDVIECRDGTVELSFPCLWGCVIGRGRSCRPRRHLHGGGFVGEAIGLGDHRTHCEQPGAPRDLILVPANIPDGYAVDPDDPYQLLPIPLVEVRLEHRLAALEAEERVARSYADRLQATPVRDRVGEHALRLRRAKEGVTRLERRVRENRQALAEFEAKF